MPSFYDSPQLTQAREGAYQATQKANTEEQAGMTLADSLREALTKKFSTANPLVQDRESSLSGYLSGVEQAPLSVTPRSAGGQSDVVYTPQEQAALIAGRRAVPTAKLATSNFLLGLGTGGIEDVVGSTSRAHEAYTKGLRGNAELANTRYKDILGELSARAEEAYKNASLAQRGSEASAKAEDTDAQGLMGALDEYLTNRGTTNFLDRFNPFSTAGQKTETQKKVLGQMFAKLIENGRLTDKDRDFYLGLLPQTYDPPDIAAAKIQGIKSGVGYKLGVQGQQPATTKGTAVGKKSGRFTIEEIK